MKRNSDAPRTGGDPAARILTPAQIRSFRRVIYRYFEAHQRSTLPWRSTTDPYHIFVSEVMLQQTQVDRVAVKYAQFIAAFPDWKSLAAASLEQVLSVWQGMGYNRRAKYLREAAIAVTTQHGGDLPRTPQLLATLPGIGAATASSIAAFAFNQPVVFIETNIRSVFIHHFFDGRSEVHDDEIRPLADQALDRKNPYRWYSALMDYGTMLKKANPNPSRKSAHHVRQSKFEGSQRQMRGRVIKELIKTPDLTAAQLSITLDNETEKVAVVLEGLVREGMVRLLRGRYRISV